MKKITNKKPFLVFSTPRSGSNPFCEVFGNYLQLLTGQANYGEIFNMNIILSNFHLEKGFQNQSKFDPIQIFKQRFTEIESDPNHFFFKVFPNQINAPMLVYLQSKYEFIFLERRNVWEQLLSYLISSSTQKWYEEGGINAKERELIAKKEHFNTFFRMRLKYKKVRDEYRYPKVIFYEDFLSLGISKVIASIGLEPIDESLFQTKPLEYKKQNDYDKETRFLNLDEIRNWYQEQILNTPL